MRNKSSLFSLKLLIFHFHATNTIIISFLPIYLKFKGLTGTEIGWVLAIGPFASIISQPFWGYLSDKYKTVKRMLIVSIIGMLLASVIFFQMNHLLAILMMGAIFYFFSSPVGALSDSLAQRRANDLKISFGTIRMWGSIGFAFSSLLVGEVLTKIGVQYIVWPYVMLGTILLIISFTIKDVETDSTSTVDLSDFGTIFKHKPFVIFLIFIMFISIPHRANDSFIGIFMTEIGGSENLVGLAWFIGVISEAAVFAFAAFWFRKFHPITFVIIASLLYSLRWFILGVIDSPILIVIFQILHGLAFGIFYLATFDYVTKIIPTHLQSTGHLIFYSVLFGVSGIIGSMGGGMIIEAYGGHTLYQLMGFISVFGVLCFFGYQIWLKKLEIVEKSE